MLPRSSVPSRPSSTSRMCRGFSARPGPSADAPNSCEHFDIPGESEINTFGRPSGAPLETRTVPTYLRPGVGDGAGGVRRHDHVS